jgi:glutaredoxin
MEDPQWLRRARPSGQLEQKSSTALKIAKAGKADYLTVAAPTQAPPRLRSFYERGKPMWRRLWDWLRPGPPLSQLVVTLYTRAGCHLCEDAHTLLQREQRRYRFQLRLVDIETSTELMQQHGEWVPVVHVDGKLRFRGGVNRLLLRRLLDAERRKLVRPQEQG